MSNHDDLRQELVALSERLRNLETVVPQMLQRLYRLEQRVGMTAPAPRVEATAPPPPRPPQPEPVTVSAPATLHTTGDLEVQIGGTWLNRIGVVAVIIGVILFLGYAFQNGWINPALQIILGLMAGLALLGLGEYFTHRQDKASYGQGLTGGGIALLYASVYAAYNYYQLIDPLNAFVFMVVVTAVGVGLSLRYDAVAILALATLGGFLTPVFIQPTGEGASTGVNLFIYMTLLDLGILAAAYYKQWLPINLLVFAGTELLFIGWMGKSYRHELLAMTFLFATVFFLIFIGVACIYNVARRYPTKEQDTALLWLNPAIYYGISYWLLHREWHSAFGLFTLGLAVLYVLAGTWALQMNPNDKMLRLSLFGIGITFAVIFVPVQLHQRWIGPAWAAQAIALTCIGFSTRSFPLRMAGLAVLMLSLVAVIAFPPPVDSAGFVPVLNARFALYAGEVIIVFILAYLYSRNAHTLDVQEKPLRNILTIGGNVLLLCALTLEVNTYFDQSGSAGQNNAKQFAISALWGIYSIVVIVIGIAQHYQPIRLFALTVFSITIFKVFLVDMSFLDASYRILSFIGLGVTLLIASYIYQRYQAQIREFALGE